MKNIILLFSGFIIGSVLVIGGLFLLDKTTSTKTTDISPIIPKQSISIDTEHTKTQTYSPDKIIPRENIVLLTTPVLDILYKKHLDEAISLLNTLIIENNTVILPAMQNLPARLSSGDWKSVFDEITNVKIKIDEVKSTLLLLNTELEKLESSNLKSTDSNIQSQTISYIEASRQFTKTYASYLTVLNTLLDGTVPDQSKLQKLNSTITLLRGHTEDLQKKGDYLFVSIRKLENKK